MTCNDTGYQAISFDENTHLPKVKPDIMKWKLWYQECLGDGKILLQKQECGFNRSNNQFHYGKWPFFSFMNTAHLLQFRSIHAKRKSTHFSFYPRAGNFGAERAKKTHNLGKLTFLTCQILAATFHFDAHGDDNFEGEWGLLYWLHPLLLRLPSHWVHSGHPHHPPLHHHHHHEYFDHHQQS